jgi:hypothetical protein
LSFVNFQGKLTGTSFDLFTCEASLFGLLCAWRQVQILRQQRLHDAANTKGGKWIKELPNALWGLRTQPSKPTGQSPYFLVYGSEAILPADVMWDSPVVEQYDEGISEDSIRVDIDGLEEARCATLVQSARYLEGIRRYHDCNIKERYFNVGDLVLRRIQNTEGLHRLSSP